jgi:endonuclease/exonuclease/phosphatase family metal-dependent hydrolase
MLAPAALVTALVVTVGFLVDPGGDDAAARRTVATGGPSATPTPSTSTTPSVSTSASPSDLAGPEGRRLAPMLIGPRVVLKPKPKPKPKFRTLDAFSFTIGTFNVLGHSHTVPGGNRPGYASSRKRMGLALDALYSRGVDIVGLQEFQAAQFNNFRKRAGGTWDVWPGMAVGHNGVENSVAWRRDQFEAVEKHTIGIPYFGGRHKQMPYVQLRHRASGQLLWVANFHNPASTRGFGGSHKFRRAATKIQIGLANTLDDAGHPVFLTGDFNERAEYFCPLTANTALKAANGGSTGSSCSPPPKMQVDWIFGPDQVTFGGYDVVDGRTVDRASDHPLVVAGVTVPELREPIVHADRD